MPELTKEQAQEELKGLMAEEKKSMATPEELKTQQEASDKAKEDQAKAEANKAEEDAILAKKEEERSDEEKKRVADVEKQRQEDAEKKAKEEEDKLPADEKTKRIQEKTQKRIDQMSSELKAMRDQSSKEAEELRAEIETLRIENDTLKAAPKGETFEAKLAKVEKDRVAQYQKEDADRPREERREMPKEELDDWYLEDAVAATEWMQKRLLRREREKDLDIKRVTADENARAQQESLRKVFIKHPDLNIEAKIKTLKAQGKSEAEAQEILKPTIEKLKKLTEIVKSNPVFLSSPDGPERAIEAMEKSSTSKNSESEGTIAALQAKVEELSTELAALRNSDEGINSTTHAPKAGAAKLTAMENEIVSTMKAENASQESIDSAIKKYRSNQGK